MLRKTFLTIMAIICVSWSGTSATGNETSEIIVDSFRIFKMAIVNKDGKTAVGWLDKASLRRFAFIRDYAVNGDDEKIAKLRLLDRFYVMLLRKDPGSARLAEMTGDEMFIYAVNRGWICHEEFTRLDAGKVKFGEGRRTAAAVAVINGANTPLDLKFVREGNQWKFSLEVFLKHIDRQMKGIVKNNNLSEDEYLSRLVRFVEEK